MLVYEEFVCVLVCQVEDISEVCVSDGILVKSVYQMGY